MQAKRWITVILFLGAALLSAMLSPALSPGGSTAASTQSQADAPAGVTGVARAINEQAPALAPDSPELQAVLWASISLPLWPDDTVVYAPVIQKP